MAIRTGREGPPSPGSGFSRLTGRKRTALLAGIPILLVLLGLTFDKTLFLFRLAGAALFSGKDGRGRLGVLADCAYRRPGLLPLLLDESADPEFLAGWLAAHNLSPKAIYGVHYTGAAPPEALDLAARR